MRQYTAFLLEKNLLKSSGNHKSKFQNFINFSKNRKILSCNSRFFQNQFFALRSLDEWNHPLMLLRFNLSVKVILKTKIMVALIKMFRYPEKIAYDWKPSTVFAKGSILDVWLDSEYGSGIHVTNLHLSYVNIEEHCGFTLRIQRTTKRTLIYFQTTTK